MRKGQFGGRGRTVGVCSHLVLGDDTFSTPLYNHCNHRHHCVLRVVRPFHRSQVDALPSALSLSPRRASPQVCRCLHVRLFARECAAPSVYPPGVCLLYLPSACRLDVISACYIYHLFVVLSYDYCCFPPVCIPGVLTAMFFLQT